jgi:hypothetical protein
MTKFIFCKNKTQKNQSRHCEQSAPGLRSNLSGLSQLGGNLYLKNGIPFGYALAILFIEITSARAVSEGV